MATISTDFLWEVINRKIVNIGGNNYRVTCTEYFGNKFVHLYVNWIGPHSRCT